jgi:hypothetical protein
MTITVLDEGRAGTPNDVTEPGGGRTRHQCRLRRVLGEEIARFAAADLLSAWLVATNTFAVVSRNVGLSRLRDLVADAGGSLHVESHPGGGTRVSVKVPA